MTQVYNAPLARILKNTGEIAPGFQLFFYITGTSTKKAIFADKDLTSALTNPVIADANGRFPQIFMQGTGDSYKAVMATDTDTDPPTSPIWTADPIEVDANDINAFDTRPAQHWGTTTNTSSAYQISPTTPITAYSNDLLFSVQIHTNAAAGATLAAEDGNDLGNFLAALNIKKYDGAGGKVDNEAKDLLGNQTYIFRIDSTDAVVLNPEIQERVNANSLVIPDNGALTISSGAITITDSYHSLKSESASDPDTLVTINGGVSGQILTLLLEASDEPITFDSGADNIICPNGFDVTASNVNQRIRLQFDGTNWVFLDIKLPGDTVQSVSTTKAVKQFITGTTIPFDNTPPLNTEGAEVFTRTITMEQPTNTLRIWIQMVAGCDSGEWATTLFKDSDTVPINTFPMDCTTQPITLFSMIEIKNIGIASEITFKVRAGASAGDLTINGADNNLDRFGGSQLISSIIIEEIQV